MSQEQELLGKTELRRENHRMSHKQPFDPEKALEQYTELERRISVGAHSERDHEGNSAEDSIEEAHDKLEYQAALRGLQFVRVEQNPARYELHPMEPEQIEAFIDALLEGNDILRELLRAAVQKLEYEEELVKRAREVLGE